MTWLVFAIYLVGVFVLGYIHGRDNPEGTPPDGETMQAVFAWPLVLVMMLGAMAAGLFNRREQPDEQA